VNARHIIITCGVSEKVTNGFMITAFCLQKSALKSDLHEIKGKIVIGSATEIENFQCTCTAGDSVCCKHISGTFLYTGGNS
jgi:hypothetical protein